MNSVPPADRPRERLLSRGSAGLSDSELIALLLGSGHSSSGNALSVAAGLIAGFGGLRSLFCASVSELTAAKGMGPARAARLQAAGELARRLASEVIDRGTPVSSSETVYAGFGHRLADEKREVFYVLLLDMKNRLIREVRISEGSLGSALVHPREAFRPAVREAAASVIFLHNHPSGVSSPSIEDRRITARLREAGSLLGIPVLDHVIVGVDEYYSFADSGWE